MFFFGKTLGRKGLNTVQSSNAFVFILLIINILDDA